MRSIPKSLLAAVIALFPASAFSESGPGLAMRAEPKYPAQFSHVEYASPDALKGGTITLGESGTVDTLNFYAVKGVSAPEIARYVFGELGESTLDEPFTKYPSLAESFKVAHDRLSMTVTLRPEAKFSDGKPVTADDVIFSLKTFRSDKVAPFYKFYWSDIKSVTAIDKKTVLFTFAKDNPELPMIVTELPILPKHIYSSGDFSSRAVGTGPYTVKDFKPGSSLKLVRQKNWWGDNLGLNKGRYNFDEIVIKYYKDPTAETEGFKKGDFDVYPVVSAKVWAMDLTGDRFEKLKYIKKELLPNSNNQGVQGFFFNLRNPIFEDIKVRQAITLALDFEWSNKNLFYGQYQQSESFFENSPLKAEGLPLPEELALLEPLKAELPPEVFSKPMGYLGKGLVFKDRLREAMRLLKEAGYQVDQGVAKGPKGPLEFKLLLSPQGFQRIAEPFIQNLKKLGIIVSIEEKEMSVYAKRVEKREFDMIVGGIGQSQSPGNEQKDFWTSEAAKQNYSRNFSGLQSKAVDTLVDKIIYAKTRKDLEIATKALDRVLYHNHILVMHWYTQNHRLAFWDKFARPSKLPSYYALSQLLEFMWIDPKKASALETAKAKGEALR